MHDGLHHAGFRRDTEGNIWTIPRWAIFDVRHDLFDADAGPRAYRAGHIPGARFASIDDDLSGTKTGRNGRHPLPVRNALVERFRAWGIGNDSQIVAYDAQGGQFAARLWWLARWLGHHARCGPGRRLAGVERCGRSV